MTGNSQRRALTPGYIHHRVHPEGIGGTSTTLAKGVTCSPPPLPAAPQSPASRPSASHGVLIPTSRAHRPGARSPCPNNPPVAACGPRSPFGPHGQAPPWTPPPAGSHRARSSGQIRHTCRRQGRSATGTRSPPCRHRQSCCFCHGCGREPPSARPSLQGGQGVRGGSHSSQGGNRRRWPLGWQRAAAGRSWPQMPPWLKGRWDWGGREGRARKEPIHHRRERG